MNGDEFRRIAVITDTRGLPALQAVLAAIKKTDAKTRQFIADWIELV
ncbi:hypothetical protein [Terribacillus halophilus]|jgi:hypothetical protein|nr:hypothetical protein [Terribacillus halophilus]